MQPAGTDAPDRSRSCRTVDGSKKGNGKGVEADVTRISLLSRVRNAADQGAWAEFEARYRDLILRYALARGLQHADAEDVRQLVMMSLAKALRNFTYAPQRGRFRSYLGRIVRNAVSRLRTRPERTEAALDSYVEETLSARDDSGTDSLWEREWVDHHYRLALRTLRQSFEARSIEAFEQLIAGKSVAQTAAEFSLSQEAVHKIKQRIRDRMKELIAAQVQEEDELDSTPSS